MANAYVFIIHPEKDNDILQKLVSEYNDRTFGNVILQMRFVDSSQASQLGCDFGAEIKLQIDQSECVLALVTPNTKKSTWVNQEIGYTIGKGIPLLPVKKRSMANRGCGLIHSNIDGQLFRPDQTKFPKLDKFFEDKFKKMTVKVVKSPIVTKPIEESRGLPARRVIPSESE